MEKGTIKAYNKNCGTGMISRAFDVDVKFYADGIVGKDRASLAPGDPVWFEMGNVKNLRVAINIRKV